MSANSIMKKPKIKFRAISNLEKKIQSMTLVQLIAIVSGILISLGVIMNVSGLALDYALRWWQSGPQPYAARVEVQTLAEKTAMRESEITKQLDNLQIRASQSLERGATVAEALRDLQINILKTKLSDAQADMDKHPDSSAARKLVVDLQAQLDAAQEMMSRLK